MKTPSRLRLHSVHTLYAKRMKEAILRDFFLGNTSIEDLAKDLSGSIEKRSMDSYNILIEDMKEKFDVFPEGLIKICDEYLRGKLSEENIKVIGFAMEASDFFYWDSDTEEGMRITDTINCWSSPEINYKINDTTMKKFRTLLETGENHFNKGDHSG